MTSRKGSPRRTYDWQRTRTAVLSDDERKIIQDITDLHGRIHVPTIDPEPPYSAELVDRTGTVWRRDHHSKDGGWSPEGESILALRWSSPAMFAAGPFIGPRRRTEDEIRADKASAARARWDREQQTGRAA